MGPKSKKAKQPTEEERKKKEEEDRKAAEEAEKQRIEKERIQKELEEKQREEERRIRAAELERLKEDFDSLLKETQANDEILGKIEDKEASDREWNRYMSCSLKPNPEAEAELNSFLSTWMAEPISNLDHFFRAYETIDEVMRDLQEAQANAEASGDRNKADRFRDFVLRIREFVTERADTVTRELLANETGDKSKTEPIFSYSRCDFKYGVWINSTGKGFRLKKIAFEGLGISVDLPKNLSSQTLALRAIQTPYDHVSFRSVGSSEMALGAVCTVQLMSVPPPPWKIKGWTMREVSPNTLSQVIPYPPEDKGMSTTAALPIRVSFTLPEDVVIDDTFNSHKVGWWNAASQMWDQESLTEVTYTPESRVLSLQTLHLAPFAVVQDRRLDLGYRSWSVQPLNIPQGDQSSVFTLEGPRFSVSISVGTRSCSLLQPDIPGLKNLLRKEMSPGELIRRLKASGVNLQPRDDDAELPLENFPKQDVRTRVTPKDASLEEKLYREISWLSSSFEVLSSGWNYRSGPSEAVIRIKESAAFAKKPHQEVDLEAASRTKCCIVQAQEGDKTFNANPAALHQSHACIKQSLHLRCLPETMDRMNRSSLQYQKIMEQLLRMVRPASFG